MYFWLKLSHSTPNKYTDLRTSITGLKVVKTSRVKFGLTKITNRMASSQTTNKTTTHCNE
jgi:hypothetical protein